MQQLELVNILIVDDKPDKLLALETIISDLGNVVKATSGKEALRCVLKQEFAVILLDVNMPGMDGFDTAALIRQRPNSERTPIIFITSFYTDADIHMTKGYSLGAVDYILAPVIPEVLRAKVSVFVDLFRKTEQVKRRAEERIQLAREQAARTAAEAAERRAAFLAEASRLLVSDMDYAVALEEVAKLAVPQLADWCAFDVANGNGSVKRVALAPANSPKTPLVRELESQYPDSVNAPFALPRTLPAIEPELVAELPQSVMQLIAKDAQHCKLIQDLGVQSYMIVPLQVRDRKLGRMTLAVTDSGRTYTHADLHLARDLANRAAVAIDNAVLYRETRNAASRLKLLSTELEEANRAKDEFLALMSHELRTPLTPILGWVRMFSRGTKDPAEMARGLKVIERNVLAQAKLVEDLLDVSRIITGKLRLNIRQLDIADVVEAGIDAVRSAADAKEINIESDMDGASSAGLMGDPDRLQQVVWNLLSNSVKFTPKNGKITVQLKRDDPQLKLIVCDTGKGISREFMPHLFERFRQGDSSSTRAYGGLGLGLAIVRHLVELHGGSVTAESEGEGKGSMFTVVLPVRVSKHESKSTPRPRLSSANNGRVSLTGLRILMVEDEPDSRDLLATILQQEGATVTATACAKDAMLSLETSVPDILISDIAMPDEDGYSLIRKVRARAAGQGGNVPAIALTAYAKEEDRARALAEGFQVHVSKPIDPMVLVEVVATLAKQCQPA